MKHVIKAAALTAVLALSAAGSYAATLTACHLDSVTLEGGAADSCFGMFEGNVNSLADINSAAGTSFVDYDDTSISSAQNTFIFGSSYGGSVAIALKQNTSWGVWVFDLAGRDIGANGVWDAAWNTSFTSWDGNPKTSGCQGCGGLSHGAIAYNGNGTEVPVPGTLSLLGLGLIGLGALRRAI